MENFECPFTWEMSELIYVKTKYDFEDNEEIIPLMKLMRCIVHVYEYIKNNKSSEAVLEELRNCDSIMSEIEESSHPEIAIKAVRFVLRSTKCYVFLHFKMEPELKQIIAQTKSIDPSEKKQTSTIKACKSIARSKYSGKTEAIKFIREAIADNPNCDLWYFILGKLLRSQRRFVNFCAKPDAEEIESFKKAYDMMKNPVYGAYLGKAYSEKGQYYYASEIFKEVLQHIHQYDWLLLLVALSYIYMKDFPNANLCLENVTNKSAGMYLHYKAKYHVRQKQYEHAATCLQQAIELKVLPAEYDYMILMQKISNTSFNVINHLRQMLVKYENWQEDTRQTIIVQLAFSYYKKDDNIEKSLEYFLEAIQINPDAIYLKEPLRPILFLCRPEKNIYAILSQDILPIVRQQPERFNEHTKEIARTLERYCNQHQS